MGLLLLLTAVATTAAASWGALPQDSPLHAWRGGGGPARAASAADPVAHLLHEAPPTPAAALLAGGHGSCQLVTAFGALGDGEHDDTAAFQKAADAASAAGGGCVGVPPAQRGAGYVLTATVTLAAGVKLVGDASGFPEIPHGFGPPGDVNTTGGSRIFARGTTPRAPLFHLTQGSCAAIAAIAATAIAATAKTVAIARCCTAPSPAE